MKVAVISDTHGLLRPEVVDTIKGSDFILHGGDINRKEILEILCNIAPLYVVRGNNDKDWAEALPTSESFSLDEVSVFMTHKKKDLPKDLSSYDLIITGHTHRYELKNVDNQLFLNPGSCGPRKPDQPITMAVLYIDGRNIQVDRIDIPHQKQ